MSYHTEDTLGCHYQYTHESGRKYIAQTDREFFFLQGHGDENSKVPATVRNFKFPIWGGRSYSRLGYKEWRNHVKDFHLVENKLNKFWEGARGFEKLWPSDGTKFNFSRLPTGWYGCPLKRFLAEMQGQAIMEGNREAYFKAGSLFPKGNQLFLPAPKKPSTSSSERMMEMLNDPEFMSYEETVASK